MKYLVSLFVLFFSLNAASEVVELNVDYSKLLEEVAKGEVKLELPEFEIYNSSGEQILFQKSLPKNFKEIIVNSISKEKSKGKNINSLEGRLILSSDKSKYKINYKKYDYVFVEYWAEWCAPCRKQMQIIGEYIKENPTKNILWLKVEKDPTKADGVKLEKG